ncbi:hypothetical protein OESDEN_01664 [Oesophagostomum dentatum]|uniref:Uncharacterized protein n=1 Tax=Oesophagostomum dentatum TaxID=61180 RepID=A0A0B1TR86_OESDE|nr:hypothetical protein OESDEN_01664 [Oesophagostomum dentatum]
MQLCTTVVFNSKWLRLRHPRVESESNYDTHYIFGVRHRGANVSAFCGALARKHFADVPIRRRDAILFTPAQDLPNGLSNIVVSIPRMWFREMDEDNRLPDVPMMFCYEGVNFLRLLPLTVYQSDLQKNGEFMEYKHVSPGMPSNFCTSEIEIGNFQQHQFNVNLSIRGVALILDKKWNNAYLLPHGAKVDGLYLPNEDKKAYLQATFTADAYHDRKRHVITRSCTPELLRNQECCLWQYRSVFAVGGKNKEVVFHRCVGKVPVEQVSFPFVSDSHEEIAKRGGLSR